MLGLPSPGDAFNAVKNTVTKAPAAAVNAGEAVVDKAGDVVDVAKQAPGVVKDTVEDAARYGKYVLDHPPDLGQIKRTTIAFGKAVITGEKQAVTGNIKPYDRLDADEKTAAFARGQGKSVEQPYIAGDAAGTNKNEPINVIMTGSKQDVEAAFKKAGWLKAPGRNVSEYAEMGAKVLFGLEQNTNGPVSAAYVDGKSEAMAFNKNDDYNAARDHVRIYPLGKDAATGQERWGVAGTRDIAMTLSRPELEMDGIIPKISKAPGFSHEIDKNIDGERDMIMANMLDTGMVDNWEAVDGKRSGAPETRQEDGMYALPDGIMTDGKVYTLNLKPSIPPEKK